MVFRLSVTSWFLVSSSALLSLTRLGPNDRSRGIHINIHRFADPQEERARILHSPLYVRDGKVQRGRPMIGEHFYLSRDNQFVICTVNRKNSMQANGRFPLLQNRSIDAIQAEGDFRVALALQNFTMHLPVTHAVAALAGPGIHSNFTGEVARARIKVQRTRPGAESAVNRVQHIGESEIDGGLLRI